MKRFLNYQDNPVNQYHLQKDILWETPFSSVSESVPFHAVRFLEEKQLMHAELWKLFIRQYELRPDAEDSGWRGEYWGKMMRAACFCFRLTGNKELYQVLQGAVSGLLKTAEEDGRISSYPRNDEFKGWDLWSRKYVLLGCEYFYDICDDPSFKREIIEACRMHLDYIIAHIGEGEGKRSILATSKWWGCMNSCSILEPVVRLYDITGEKKYLDFADYIVSTGGSNLGNILELAIKNEIPPYQYPVVKAYETMSFFEGIAEYYRVTGKEEYKSAVIHFVDRVLETDYTIIGNCGCTHELFDNSSVQQTEPNSQVAQETCVAVTLSKLLYQVLCLTGELKYAEAMERTYYNSILGSINFAGNVKLRLEESVGRKDDYSASEAFCRKIGGFPFDSYSPLYKSRRNRAVGGYKDMENNTAYGCCACIGAAGAALLPLTAIMTANNAIVLNQYIEGSFTVPAKDGHRIELAIHTKYPYDGKICIDVDFPLEEAIEIKLRIPSFGQTAVFMDGLSVECVPGAYCTCSLTQGHHRIQLEADTALHTITLNQKVALLKGCIVLAADNRNGDPDTMITGTITAVQEAPHDFDCHLCYDVSFSNQNKVRLVDYASAGSNWDSEDSYMTAWFDAENS